MAIKDWKRVTNNMWENRKSDQTVSVKKFEGAKEKGWIIILNESDIYKRRGLSNDLFKTKSQATSFAKQYMRSH